MLDFCRWGGAARQPLPTTEPCQCVSGQPWACHGPLQGQVQPLQCEAGVVELAVLHGMPRAGHSHTGRALCAVVAGCCLLLWKCPQTGKTAATPNQPPAQPCRSPQCRPHHTCCTQHRLHLTFQCPMACPGLATHTLAGLCALLLPSGAAAAAKLQKWAKPQTTSQG